MALQAYEDDLCPGCGQPRTYAFDADAAGRYGAHAAVCHACATLQRSEKSRGSKNPPPGHREYVIPDEGLAHAMRHPIHVPPFTR